ncbi:PREDICTED: uncharacterized protein LOC109238677 [Nicotiana attenuata]|uniref:uncharacterized protein LOC109238677 n=1 Tax=Nicotiana attenuata TaxID=49451 RepID=UPI000905528F|nr:PREDICTED: uncharacterized protein LOC109238677 [Nicotiana attenuata]
MEPLQLSNWVAIGEGSSCMLQETTMPVMLQKEEPTNSAIQRLNFPKEQVVPSPIKVKSEAEGPTMADVVKNNRAQHLGMQLKFFPPVINNGVKAVQLNEIKTEKHSRQWINALIGYVLGGMPSFKEMLQFVYGVWQFVSTPRVFLHEDGYFIFKFESEDDMNLLLQNGPYTFNSRSMILKEWIPYFTMNKEPLRLVPLWVSFPKLPLQCWTEENSGWLASYLGRPICTDKLTAKGDRISYATVLIEMDITQQLPEVITIEKSDGTIWEQDIDYDWKPRFYQNCAHFGHFTESCGKEDQQEQNVQQKGQKKGKQKPSQEKKEWKVKQDKPNIKPQDPIAIEEDHSAPTKCKFKEVGSRGSNKAHKQKEFKDFLLGKKIDLIGCLETRVKQHKAVNVIRKFGNDWEFYKDYTHAPNGRIWVGWRRASVAVNIRYSTTQLIHCFVEDRQSQFNCELTYVYGYNTIAGRKPLWDQLRNIRGSINGPWILLGDFNTILFSDDRVNGVPVHPAETVDFQNCITDLGVGQCSDHSPIVINTVIAKQYLKKPLRLLNVQLQLDAFKAIVQNVWQQTIEGHCMYGVWQKLKLVEAETKQLNKEYSSLEGRIMNLKHKLGEIQDKLAEDLFNGSLINEEKEILIEMEKWGTIHERVLRQKSRATWISLEVSNTRFFHAHMKARQARNRISSIQNEQGVLITDPKLIQQEFLQFFKKLLGTAAEELPYIDTTVARNGPCLTIDQQKDLIKPFTTEEVS